MPNIVGVSFVSLLNCNLFSQVIITLGKFKIFVQLIHALHMLAISWLYRWTNDPMLRWSQFYNGMFIHIFTLSPTLYYSIVRRWGIWNLNIYVGNTRSYLLSHKTLGIFVCLFVFFLIFLFFKSMWYRMIPIMINLFQMFSHNNFSFLY